MAWTTPRTYTVGEQVTEAILDADQKANLDALSGHTHSNAAGDGSSTLGNLSKVTITDGSAPSAPSAGLTSIYAVSGALHYRPNGGSDTEIQDANDLHAEVHASTHQPGGGDAMEVDAVAGTGSLRTLGSGARQLAAGNHGHA